MKRVAIIDLGSNSVRMNIMQINENGSYYLADQVKQMVRLSQNMGKERTLKPEPIKRTIETLKLFRMLIEAYHVEMVYSIATAAVRQAKNQKEVLEKLQEETGFYFDVISGEEEAYYDYLGVMNTMDAPHCLVVDIGGASTELVWVENRKIIESVSIPFGSVTLSEQFMRKSCGDSELEKLKNYIIKQLKNVPWFKDVKGLPVLGLGGIVRTIGKIDKNRVQFPAHSIHNYQMDIKEVDLVYQKIVSTSVEELRAMPGIGKSRADLMAGGLVPLKCIMEMTLSPKLIISGNGLRDGVFFKRVLLPGDQDLVENVLEFGIRNLMMRYDLNINHANKVKTLSLKMFDQLKDLHQLGGSFRKILETASMLHDIGMHIDYYNHHYHGFYVMMNSDLNGLSNRERVLSAMLVGMHRESSFREDWRKYKAVMNRNDFEEIRKMAIFLKIAEKLDRSEFGLVKDIQMKEDKKDVTLVLAGTTDLALEVASAVQYQGEFKKAFRKNLKIVVKNQK